MYKHVEFLVSYLFSMTHAICSIAFLVLIGQWSDTWKYLWHGFMLMEQFWLRNHGIALEMEIAGDVLLGYL